MRRIAAVVAIASLLALAGCSTLPAGVDGDLTNSWAPMAAPTPVLPGVGKCYTTVDPNMQENTPVACTQAHGIEVVKVGTFVDANASLTKPPAHGSAAIKGAYAQCNSAATAYLGGDFHGGLLGLAVLTPDPDAWLGGARWFACAVNQVKALSDLESVDAVGSLHGVLAKPGPVKLGCITWTDHKTYLDNYRPASCAKSHTGEYVGATNAIVQKYPSGKQFGTLASDGCERLVAKYLGLSGSRDTSQSVGWAWSYVDKTDWNDGDHYIRCYAAAFTRDGKFVGSVEGIGLRTAKG